MHTTLNRPAHRALERYLQRATWGLPRARRQELRDELEEHLLTRIHHLMAFGAHPQDALNQALSELGAPERVSAGMTEVYLMPKLLRATALIALPALLTTLALSSAQPQVGVTYTGPPRACQECAPLPADQRMIAWINMAGLERTLETQGVQVRRGKLETVLNFPDLKMQHLPSTGVEVRIPLSLST